MYLHHLRPDLGAEAEFKWAPRPWAGGVGVWCSGCGVGCGRGCGVVVVV